MAFVHQQAAKLDEQTKASVEQSVTIAKQSEMIQQLREVIRINELFFYTSGEIFYLSVECLACYDL